jgi:hypothetical protein
MINASSMPALLPSFLGVSHTISAGHNNRRTTLPGPCPARGEES